MLAVVYYISHIVHYKSRRYQKLPVSVSVGGRLTPEPSEGILIFRFPYTNVGAHGGDDDFGRERERPAGCLYSEKSVEVIRGHKSVKTTTTTIITAITTALPFSNEPKEI